MRRFASTSGLLLSLTLALSGCGFFAGARVEAVKTVVEQPGLVSVYLSVERDGKPIDYLHEKNFELFENGVELGKEVGMRLLPRDRHADGHTVLLLDVSGAPDAELLRRMTKGATHFIEKVTTTQSVTLAVFDGSAKIKRIASYPRVAERQEPVVPNLAEFAGRDPSRDLNGSVLASLGLLEKELAHSTKSVKVGTLVVLARGPDLAGRKTDTELYQALNSSPMDRFLLVPEGVEIPTRDALASDGVVTFKNAEDIALRMSDVGMSVRRAWGKYYFLAYCSPARAGERTLTIRLNFQDEQGQRVSVDGETTFSSNGFSSGCAVPSVAAPPVAIAAAEAAPPPPAASAAEPAKPKKPAKKPASNDTPAKPAKNDEIVAPRSDKYD